VTDITGFAGVMILRYIVFRNCRKTVEKDNAPPRNGDEELKTSERAEKMKGL
jgi:hypothetical protein